MSYETISNRIKDILNGVAGVHNVHTYMRDISDEEEFERAFSIPIDGEETLLTSWMITRKSLATERQNLGTDVITVTHNIEIEGFYALKDAEQSELKFQEILDQIITRFKSRFQLEDDGSNVLAGIEQTAAFEIPEIGHGEFSNYFVHFCRVVLFIKERIQ